MSKQRPEEAGAKGEKAGLKNRDGARGGDGEKNGSDNRSGGERLGVV